MTTPHASKVPAGEAPYCPPHPCARPYRTNDHRLPKVHKTTKEPTSGDANWVFLETPIQNPTSTIAPAAASSAQAPSNSSGVVGSAARWLWSLIAPAEKPK